jgi:gamma-glutamylcyclotransferase (GGCT)/AIG2-like uncharacterized protein YtfP
MPGNLFTYGTLQNAEVLAQVVGRSWPSSPALLDGYARYRVNDKPYPAIVEQPGAQVQGSLYSGVTQRELERLDDYEGELYERCSLRVWVGTQAMDAFTYLLRAEYRALLSAELWELADFEREHLASYLSRISVTGRAP